MSNEDKILESNNQKPSHTHSCSCGGHCHNHGSGEGNHCCSSKQEQGPINIEREEIKILIELKEYTYMPIAEFVMCNSANSHVSFSALAPVYLESIDDDMGKVKELAKAFKDLEKKGLITLDYDIPLKGFDYSIYTDSNIYKYFIETVEEGKNKPDFLCDTTEIEFGSVALTDLGKRVVSSIEIEQ